VALWCSSMVLMAAKQQEQHTFLSFVAWLVWVAAATVVLGGVAYLFVGGSVLFSQQNTAPIVAYRQLGAASISLTGSVVLQSSCEQLHLANTGDALLQKLDFMIREVSDCNAIHTGNIPETFFIELEGDGDTKIEAMVNGVKRAIIIK